jgi:bifunctional DNA-binding transcriptional regulator/antitoxin component of YhaV-PrlF toxin-antitoxin module
MIIRISPQWQLTIPSAFRPQLGLARRMEARVERGALVLRPVISDSVADVARHFAPEGITPEVLWEAMRVVEAKRRKAAEGE